MRKEVSREGGSPLWLGQVRKEYKVMESIGIDWKILIPQIINFLVLLIIMRVLLYKPILKILGDRKSNIENSLALAEKTKKEAEELEIKNLEKIKLVKLEALKIIEDSRNTIQTESKTLKEKATSEAAEIIKKAHSETEFERQKMISSLKKELAELVLLVTGKLTKKTVEVSVQRQLVDDVIKDLENKEFN
jgi:F-type H+-transporting ATPase subunit b